VPVAGSTHDVELRGEIVIKRFRSWSRDEHRREWRALTLLAEWRPGLAPRPISADLSGDPPTVVMSRVRGNPMHGTLVRPEQLDALASAVNALHRAIPADVLRGMHTRILPAHEFAAHVMSWCANHQPALGTDPTVHAAFDAGAVWITSTPLSDPRWEAAEPVFGLADGNLANYLWDGTRVRVVDLENSGRSDRTFELADITEHLSMWVDHPVDIPSLLEQFELTSAEVARLRECQRLFALFWLLMLLPGGAAHDRNPPGTLARQARRLLGMLG
jgi:Phosphotransferase enzyme family